MLRLSSKSGFTLIEVIVAGAITAITVVSLLNMIPFSWRVVRSSDQMGRAAGIIQAETARREDIIMRTGAIVADVNNQLVPGENINFFVTTQTTLPAGANNFWVVRVDVNWAGCLNNPCIRNTRVVSQQGG